MEKTDNWAAFGSEYLRAIDVLSDTEEYVIVDVTSKEETKNGKKKEVLHLTLERNGFEKLFGCNATNTYAIQEAFPLGPKNSIGAVVTFYKVKVQKPGTNPPEMVDGLRIRVKKEEPKEEPKEVDTDEVGVKEDGTI